MQIPLNDLPLVCVNDLITKLLFHQIKTINAMHSYDTLSEAINGLKERGYNENFKLRQETIKSEDTGVELTPDQFEVEEVHRFEGISNPADMSIVYAINCSSNASKGILVDAYGTYTENLNAEMINKLRGRLTER